MRPLALCSAAVAVVLLSLVAARGQAPPREIRLATTTSVENSGLLGFLLPQFERASGVRVQVLPVGSGQALELAARGDADVVLTHAPDLEEDALARGRVTEPRVVMENEFVLVGPPEDPAGIRGSHDIAGAMAKIAQQQAPFVSRGDRSGTHTAELKLWRQIGVRPGPPWYLEAGQGMGAALMMSAERRAYTLSDTATFLAYRNRQGLEILVRNVPPLKNVYRVFLPAADKAPASNRETARQFVLWLVSPVGQEAIAAFRIDGQRAFLPAAGTGTGADASQHP